MAPKNAKKGESEEQSRIAILNPEKCKPSKCRQECKKSCPVVRTGACADASPTPLAAIQMLSRRCPLGCG